MPNSTEDKVMTLVKHAGVLRPRDLTQHDISRQYLLRLQRRGQLQKVGRGLYIASETHLTEHQSLVEACKRVPQGIICLLSALRFHGLTTQAPSEVWMAIDDKAWRPKVDNPRLRVVRFSGECVWQLLLAHFGGLIWPTLGRCRLGEAFALPPRKNKDRRRSCGNVGIPPLWRDFQGRWKEWETVLGFSTLSTARHFHS